MNNYRLKYLIREAINEKEDLDIINAAISYLVKNDGLSADPGILLFSKAILCDKRNGRNNDYSKFNLDALELCKSVIDKCQEIKDMDPKLFKAMALDGSTKKYRKLVDVGNKIIIIGE